jgi:hypothetical protein
MSSSPSRRIASHQPHNGLINQAREEKDSDLSTCLGLVCMRDFCPCDERQSAEENHRRRRHFLLYAFVYIIAIFLRPRCALLNGQDDVRIRIMASVALCPVCMTSCLRMLCVLRTRKSKSVFVSVDALSTPFLS